MKVKPLNIIFSLFFIVFVSNSIIASDANNSPNQEESCTAVQAVYEDALIFFQTNMGEEKMKQTLYGTSPYYDYTISLWDAQRVELTEAPDLGCNLLEYYYYESEALADAETVYKAILKELKTCIPTGYISIDPTGSNYLQKAIFIDSRDNDSFMFYDWPVFEMTVTNWSGKYVVKLRIESKKKN